MTVARIVLFLPLVVACRAAAPDPTPRPAAATTTAFSTTLRTDWTAGVTVERDDSIVLTLPDGNRQLQRQGRTARFTLSLTPGMIRVTLDALTLRPALGDMANDAVGTVWTGRIGSTGRVSSLQVSRSSSLAEEMTATVQQLIPLLPAEALKAGAAWNDTASLPVRVDIFRATEHRTSRWSSGNPTDRDGIQVLPVRLRETYEQLGRGSQSGRQMTMTSQGVRTATYFVTRDGRIDAAMIQDSASKFITIANTRQSIPTTQVARITLQYGSAGARGQR